MLGAIAGDMIGAPYEFDRGTKSTRFPLFSRGSEFTDDSVLTVATADALLTGGDFAETYRRYGRLYPHAGWGGMFARWIADPYMGPYGSFGNGAAMRVSPVGWAFDDLDAVLEEARRTAIVSHDHPEGVKGAQSTAAAVFLARTGAAKADIRRFAEETFGYDLSRSLDEIRPDYRHVETCQETVPEALTAFLESEGFEDAIRKAVSLGGDCDTLACITGGVAEAFYGGVPDEIAWEVSARLDDCLSDIVDAFTERYIAPRQS
ncbi:MAG TPA: ADP-ribosylglycohydrolase family protein [Armatimonadota bacterium]|jgi:ADP-ribosylglycohydrolase